MREGFVKEILSNSSNSREEDTDKLLMIAENFLPNIMNHLKDIRQTLPNFDIHDESHAEQVLINMLTLANYYENNSLKLTNYEYFLIIMSAYLHDSGMSLPKWELNLFKATEGNDLFNLYDELEITIDNDGKRPFLFSEAKKFIFENKESIYGEFENIKSFIFIEDKEEQFTDALARKLINYQQFRNGFAYELSNVKNKNEYRIKSEGIRYEYVRSNHHFFSKRNCELLSRKIAEYSDDFIAKKLSDDLAKIVVGHGIDFSEIENYDLKSRYSNGNYANIFFITVLLRLGDVIHFSADRAPKSLMASKMIQDNTSLIHWKVKQEGIDYWLTDFNEKDNREISYSAYFEDPKLYYFFQDYMDWIDNELSNYSVFSSILKKDNNLRKFSNCYDLNIAEKVNRQAVLYNKHSFVPVDNLKFVLNQTRILELLMGVGLYKDKYLCLRELYQNSMDACKCAIANSSIDEGLIEFGIREDVNGRYLYCLDNGIGMTKQIIEDYFMNIGTSYYKSRQFYELKANWDKGVSPTSQFGIGILSCFMIGDEIEVVTKNSYENGSSLISFKVDGPHERFYYKNVEEIDQELIGSNGTLVKVYLSDKELNDEYVEDIDNKLFFFDDRNFRQMNKSTTATQSIESNIYGKLHYMINKVPQGIKVATRLNNNSLRYIIDNYEPFNLKNITQKELLEEMEDNFSKEYKDSLICVKNNWEKFKSKIVKVSSENISLTTPLVFPTIDKNEVLNNLSSFPFLKRGGLVSVDGIIIKDYEIVKKILDNMLFKDINNDQPFVINFDGESRPKLSVDRLSLTEISEELIQELKELVEKLKVKICTEISEYIMTLPTDIGNKDLILEKLIEYNKIFKIDIIDFLANSGKDIPNPLFPNLINYVLEVDQITDFFKPGVFKIKPNFLLSEYNKQEWLIYLSKIIGSSKIEIFNNYILVTSSDQLVIDQNLFRYYFEHQSVPFLTYAENWDEHFKEYDIVTGMYPIVSTNLFKLAKSEYHKEKIDTNNRINWIGSTGNGLSGIGSLQSIHLIPNIGFGSLSRKGLYQNRTPNRVLNYDHVINNYWLFELNDYGRTVREENMDYLLRAYITPSILSENEKLKLEKIKGKNHQYFTGVYEGWSVLFFGKTCEMAYLTGKCNLEDLLENVPDTFSNEPNINYFLLDKTELKI
ncbi:HD domain-containing protein [Virgibacillus pantothenticus]|uniref:HD domain-containing protein n=1 Tax=Virgibacillus pantothenticus TaxID=1473 RepID=UPI00098606CE|nr:ATP-binding protein [Virgibacillus pantothenticus]